MDTECSVIIYALTNEEQISFERKANEALNGAFNICARYDALLSRTNPSSDIGYINASKGLPVFCEESTIELIKAGMAYGIYSEGGFNICVGPIMELWDFHADEPRVPTKEEIKKAKAHVKSSSGYSDYVEIMIDGSEVSLFDPEAKIDLGGIAKGYIADQMAEYLVKQGMAGAVVNVGGDISVVGAKDGSRGNDPVEIGIKLPYSTEDEMVGIVKVQNASVSTSGVYEKYFEVDDVKYHNVINPKTGYPCDSGLQSVTVIGPFGHCVDCDALATSTLVQGEEWLKDFLKAAGVAVEGEEGEEGSAVSGTDEKKDDKKDEESEQDAIAVDEEEDRITVLDIIGDFTFILIRDDGSIVTLGTGPYTFVEK